MNEQVSSMKQTKIYASLSLVALMTVSLASCGGGGDADAGSATTFSVQPNDYTLSSQACSPAYMGDVVVVGGTAPYRLINTFPDVILLHKSVSDFTPVSSVEDRNGTFSVTFTGGCFDPGLVLVIDKLDHQVSLKLHNKAAAATTPASGAGA